MVLELFLTMLASLNFAKSGSFLDSTEAERLATDTVVANVNSLSNSGFTEISIEEIEPNERPDTATALAVASDSSWLPYHSSVSTQCYSNIGLDYDYYSFSLYTDSDVVLSLTVDASSPVSADFIVYGYHYYRTESQPSLVQRESYTLLEDYGDDFDKGYSGTLGTGSYFVLVFNKTSTPAYQEVNYDLDLFVTPSSGGHSTFSASELRFSKRLPGAVWVSDFAPGGVLPFLSNELDYTYYKYGGPSGISSPDPCLDGLLHNAYATSYTAARLYIWDGTFKLYLRQSVLTLKQKIESDYSLANSIEAAVHIAQNVVSGAAKLVGIVCNSPFEAPIIGPLLWNSTLEVAASAVNGFLELLIPRHAVPYQTFVDALDTIVNALTVRDIKGNPITDPSLLADYLDGTVFTMPLKYSFYTASPLYQTTHNFTFAPTYEYLAGIGSNYSLLQTPDIANDLPIYLLDGLISNRGKIYAMTGTVGSVEDLILAESVPFLSPECQTKTIQNAPLTANLHHGALGVSEYAWFRLNSASAGLCHIVLEYDKTSSQGSSILVEEFPSPFGGYGTDGRLALHETNYLWTGDGNSDSWNTYFSRQVAAGESIYFRVRDIEFGQTVDFRLFASMDGVPFAVDGTYTHLSHSYSYTWLNQYRHRTSCAECGWSESQVHVVIPGSAVHGQYHCALCGGRAKYGIVPSGAPIVSEISDGGSVLLSDGTVVAAAGELSAIAAGECAFREVGSGDGL